MFILLLLVTSKMVHTILLHENANINNFINKIFHYCSQCLFLFFLKQNSTDFDLKGRKSSQTGIRNKMLFFKIHAEYLHIIFPVKRAPY
jgi:hypothetical protein